MHHTFICMLQSIKNTGTVERSITVSTIILKQMRQSTVEYFIQLCYITFKFLVRSDKLIIMFWTDYTLSLGPVTFRFSKWFIIQTLPNIFFKHFCSSVFFFFCLYVDGERKISTHARMQIRIRKWFSFFFSLFLFWLLLNLQFREEGSSVAR